MSTANVTSKAQVTISSSFRATLGIDAGSRIEAVEMENGQFVIFPSVNPIQSLKGMIRIPTTPVSIEQMNLAFVSQGV